MAKTGATNLSVLEARHIVVRITMSCATESGTDDIFWGAVERLGLVLYVL